MRAGNRKTNRGQKVQRVKSGLRLESGGWSASGFRAFTGGAVQPRALQQPMLPGLRLDYVLVSDAMTSKGEGEAQRRFAVLSNFLVLHRCLQVEVLVEVTSPEPGWTCALGYFPLAGCGNRGSLSSWCGHRRTWPARCLPRIKNRTERSRQLSLQQQASGRKA